MKPDDVKLKDALGYRKHMLADGVKIAMFNKWRAVDEQRKEGTPDAEKFLDLLEEFLSLQLRLIKFYLVDESCVDAVADMKDDDFNALLDRVIKAHMGEVGVNEDDPLPTTSTKSVEDTSQETKSS